MCSLCFLAWLVRKTEQDIGNHHRVPSGRRNGHILRIALMVDLDIPQRTAYISSNSSSDTMIAIRSVFPEAATQICVVHQIRNSCRYVTYKDLKEFMVDLKTIYGTVNKEAAATPLDAFEQKWNLKYRYAVRSWRTN